MSAFLSAGPQNTYPAGADADADATPVRSRPLLRPAPVSEPPYDDELTDVAPRRMLPLRLVPVPAEWIGPFEEPGGAPFADELPFEEPAPAPPSAPRMLDLSSFEAQPTSRSGLPDPGPVAAALVRAMLEVFAGRRPVQQLMGRTSDDVYATLLARAGRRRGRYAVARDPLTGTARTAAPAAGREAGPPRSSTRSAVPGPSTSPAAAGCGAGMPRLCSVRVSEPADGVAEVSAVVRHGARTRAVALRLEGMDGRWQCTVLSVL